MHKLLAPVVTTIMFLVVLLATGDDVAADPVCDICTNTVNSLEQDCLEANEYSDAVCIQARNAVYDSQCGPICTPM